MSSYCLSYLTYLAREREREGEASKTRRTVTFFTLTLSTPPPPPPAPPPQPQPHYITYNHPPPPTPSFSSSPGTQDRCSKSRTRPIVSIPSPVAARRLQLASASFNFRPASLNYSLQETRYSTIPCRRLHPFITTPTIDLTLPFHSPITPPKSVLYTSPALTRRGGKVSRQSVKVSHPSTLIHSAVFIWPPIRSHPVRPSIHLFIRPSINRLSDPPLPTSILACYYCLVVLLFFRKLPPTYP